MAANITKMFYQGEVPWHKQGEKIDQHLTVCEAFVKIRLDFGVHTEQLQYVGGNMSGAYAVVRDDNRAELGIVTNHWKPIQNMAIATVLQDLVGSKELTVETAGQISGGKKVWMLCKLPGQIAVDKDDVINKYLAGCVGHDGTLSWHTMLTGVRIVCENTLMAALSNARRDYTVRHAANASARVEDVRKALGLAHHAFETMEAQAVHLAHIPIVGSQVKLFVNELFETKKNLDPYAALPIIGVKTQAMMEKVTQLFESGRGSNLKTAKGTAWGLYNSAVEFVDYYHKAHDQANSVLFGTGAALKRRALSTVLSLA